MSPGRTVRVAAGQGFWGDDLEAPVRQVEGGPIDYLVLDYLAEVTMSILRKQRAKDPSAGYARDFVALMERIFPACVERGIRVVSNAGGVNPLGCVEALVGVGQGAGVGGCAKVGLVTGDDLMERLDELLAAGHELAHMETGRPLSDVRDAVQSANVYLGAAPIVEALRRGAGVVLTGRTIDAALTYAPLVYEHDWPMDAYDLLAAGVVAGHINECGAQATGGNCLIDWWTIPDLAGVGFPIVEAAADGTFVVTKHEGSGGRVTRATVTEQLLYEIGDPSAYLGPDVTADFTSVELVDDGPDRVRVQGVRGGPPPQKLKVSVAYAAGWKSVGTLTYAWPDAAAKARTADKVLRERLERLGLAFQEIHTELVGWSSTHGPLAGEPDPELPEVQLRFAVRAEERAPVERFTREIAPLVLTGPPSVTGYATGRPRVDEIVAFWPALLDRTAVEPHVRVEVRDV
ncbi:MAG TPA: acyclic terpene utilization AtuA family protein [Longimicrobiales bacterium]|nr:acyclic terpene utilization AtuA family protein [Longimicrobiales bacterium]